MARLFDHYYYIIGLLPIKIKEEFIASFDFFLYENNLFRVLPIQNKKKQTNNFMC